MKDRDREIIDLAISGNQKTMDYLFKFTLKMDPNEVMDQAQPYYTHIIEYLDANHANNGMALVVAWALYKAMLKDIREDGGKQSGVK